MVIVLMGVSGAGKTTVGKLLASDLKCSFADADDFHSPANIEKMRSGTPLTDADRAPWLQALRHRIEQQIANHQAMVLACSALKNSYRESLAVSSQVVFVYLKVSPQLLHQRLRHRTGHYMTESMLASQLAALEEPSDAITVDGDQDPEAVVTQILDKLRALEMAG